MTSRNWARSSPSASGGNHTKRHHQYYGNSHGSSPATFVHSPTSASAYGQQSRKRRQQAVDRSSEASSYGNGGPSSSGRDHMNNMNPKKRRRHGNGPAPPAVLPVNEHASEIYNALAQHDVIILVGETGSGKTTQVPQQIVDSFEDASVVVTQPRRVAAVSVATRVAQERNSELGGEVGYSVRFDDTSSYETRIRYVTDGVLLRELLSPKAFEKYTHVVIDEVHERSVNTDLVLGSARDALKSRKNNQTSFKLVVMSATTDSEKLAAFFQDAQLSVKQVKVPGRLHRVEIQNTLEPVGDYIDASVTAAMQVHVDHSFPGDILVFLPGQEEILAAAALLKERIAQYLPKQANQDIRIHTLYASLSSAEQMRAIAPLDNSIVARKIIFATNVAETSITIPGIRYVVDSGVFKLRSILKSNTGICADALRVAPISEAQANQRAGRAGRVSDGIVFRLYTTDTFNQLKKFPVPEILRVEPSPALLQIAAWSKSGRTNTGDDGVNLRNFPWIDKPPKKIMAKALHTLVVLGALDDKMQLTPIGKLMAGLPIAPNMARALLEAVRLGCIDTVATAAAMLSIEGAVFLSPKSQRDAARAAQTRFTAGCIGDTMALVRALEGYLETQKSQRKEYCKSHFISERALEGAVSIRQQLMELLGKMQVPKASKAMNCNGINDAAIEEAERDELLARCLCAGYMKNVARRREDGKYSLIAQYAPGEKKKDDRGSVVEIHPSSILRNKKAKWIIFEELVITSKAYLRNCIALKVEWLWQHSNGYFDRKTTV